MKSDITLYSISDNYVASEVVTITKEYFDSIKKYFRLKDSKARFVICVGIDHTQKVTREYSYNFYEILDHNFLPVINLEGVYKLDNYKLIEGWTGKWGNKCLHFNFQSDIFDKFEVKISLVSENRQKIVQQIAIILQSINKKSSKITEKDSEQIRKNIDDYLKTKRI